MKKSLFKPNPGRRSFLCKGGAAIAAAAAAAVPGMAKNGNRKNSEADRLGHRLAILEDEKAIRELHQTYEALLNNEKYEDVIRLFTEDAAVVFNGGVFRGKTGLARLYCDRFSAGTTGKKIGPVPGLEENSAQPDILTVAEDRKSAQAQFQYSIQVGTPMTSDSSLVQMARLHGGGILKWCEAGMYQASYVKDPENGNWKIKRLEYRVLSKTDYRPGRTYAQPVSVPLFTRTYPEDPSGPDRLIS